MAQLREFYTRHEDEPGFRPEQLEVYDDLEATIQQVKMTLFTRKGEVLGEPDFGVEIEKYLFEFDIDPFSLTRDAGDQINKFVSEGRKRNITIKPASYADTKSNRDIFVLLIDIPELKSPLSIFYE